MRARVHLWLALVGMAALPASPVLAHHSFAAFQQDKEATATGTVKAWEWTNPHTFLTLSAPDASGKMEDYLIEGQSPSVWQRRGWTRNVVKIGDKVTVTFHPRKDGAPGGNFMDITSADGKSLKARSSP